MNLCEKPAFELLEKKKKCWYPGFSPCPTFSTHLKNKIQFFSHIYFVVSKHYESGLVQNFVHRKILHPTCI